VRTEKRRTRVLAAAISGAAGIVLFVAGVGLAQTTITPAQDQTATSEQSPSGKKIVICHKLKNTISVSVNAWPAHQRHGDTEGACAATATAQTTTTKSKKPKKSTSTPAETSTTSGESAPEPEGTTTTSPSSSQTPKQHKQHKSNHGNTGATSTSPGNSGKPKKPKHANGQTKHAAVPGIAPQSSGPGNGNGNGKGKDK
jgi:hypothetical protein